jgi:hypothetical protein
MDPSLVELFVDGTENALADSGRLDRLGLGEGSVVFMLQWAAGWQDCGSNIVLSGEGVVATMAVDLLNNTEFDGELVTGGSPMTEGRHYWEVEVTWDNDRCDIMEYVGAVRPGLDHNKSHVVKTQPQARAQANPALFARENPELFARARHSPEGVTALLNAMRLNEATRLAELATERHSTSSDTYYISMASGYLFRNNNRAQEWQQNGLGVGRAHQFTAGDRIGVLLDLDAGWMRFYRNGMLVTSFMEGVTGPLVRAAELHQNSSKATMVARAVAPEGAGAANEPWHDWEWAGWARPESPVDSMKSWNSDSMDDEARRRREVWRRDGRDGRTEYRSPPGSVVFETGALHQ